MSVKKTTEQFVTEGKKKRTDINYDYSKVDYVSAHTKVTIIDPDFGEFQITPSAFLRGQGHPKRAIQKNIKLRSKTTEQFVTEGKEKRTYINYDYSKANYINAYTKVTIIDPDFGEFQITPNAFLRGQGHPKRAIEDQIKSQSKTTEQFVTEGKEKRTDINYDYSKANYINAYTKVTIIDPDFGEFQITPSDFLFGGGGHPMRAIKNSMQAQSKTTEQFVTEGKEKRTDINYDYSKANYINAHTKVTIIDPDFGEFQITPSAFLRGQGHPNRTPSGFKKDKTAYYYIHNDVYNESDKAGIAGDNDKRLKRINSSFKKIYQVEVFWKNEISIFFNKDNGGHLAAELERITHTIAFCGNPHHKSGYYEKGDGCTETFNNMHRPKVNEAIKKFLAEHEGEYIIERDINGIFGEVIL